MLKSLIDWITKIISFVLIVGIAVAFAIVTAIIYTIGAVYKLYTKIIGGSKK